MGRRSARAFTLVELMAVMAIMAILLVSIIPALDNMLPSYRMSAGARHVASTIELAQSEAIGQRKEFVVAYDLDHHTYWVVLPRRAGDEVQPGDREEERTTADPAGAGASKLKRPENDVEHGLAPKDPNAPKTEEEQAAEREAALPEYSERDKLEPTPLPEDIEFQMVVVGEEEKRSGVVYVSFDQQASAGSHLVGLKLGERVRESGGDGRDELWVVFNALTRTIEYHDQRPQIPTLPGEDSSQ
ncbi:MAG: Tfp pilus assembly protein FimT/FimU [Planctomycetota bacterium]